MPSQNAEQHIVRAVDTMATRIDAIYEHGVFRPTEPVEMPEGERVQIVVLIPDEVALSPSPASVLAEIAAFPLGTVGDCWGRRRQQRPRQVPVSAV